MSKNNKKRKNTCEDPFANASMPPCASYLGSSNPLDIGDYLVVRNNNRFYYFLTTTLPVNLSAYDPLDFTTYTIGGNTNIQISLSTFLIGIFIDSVQKKVINFEEDMIIHSNESINAAIKNLLLTPPVLDVKFVPSLNVVVSNSNAVVSLYNLQINITPLNFFILLFISRSEKDPGVLVSNNSYITVDEINMELAKFNFIYKKGN